MRTVKAKFEELVKEKGYPSMRSFCKECNLDESNLYTNMKGKWGLSIKRAFLLANKLGEPVEKILEVFYSEQFAENRKIVSEKLPIAE